MRHAPCLTNGMTESHPSSNELVALVEARGPFQSHGQAEAAVRATLIALKAALHPEEWAELASELPDEHPRTLGAASKANAPTVKTADEFYVHVAQAETVPIARALEHAQIVCGVLAEAVLTPATVTRLQKHAPYLAELFEPRVAPPPPPPPVHAAVAPSHDLAGGRPGSQHPIATGNPASLAHHHSIASSDDPHADTRLSSSHGTTQERERRTLASGRPGAKRRLADSH